MSAEMHRVRFTGGGKPCASTGLFHFSRPPGYSFTAGQYFSLTLHTGEGVQTKQFTHCDAPGDTETDLLTRMTGSAFKNALAALRVGETVEFSGPSGVLVLPEGVERAAFLVGGVGITPMRSIVRDAVLRSTGLTALVFDGNADEACIPFREEFDGWACDHPSIDFVHVLEHPSAHWTGERGFISPDTVMRHCDPHEGWHWFVSGPPMMVEAMRAVLTSLDVDGSHSSFESFTGYR